MRHDGGLRNLRTHFATSALPVCKISFYSILLHILFVYISGNSKISCDVGHSDNTNYLYHCKNLKIRKFTSSADKDSRNIFKTLQNNVKLKPGNR